MPKYHAENVLYKNRKQALDYLKRKKYENRNVKVAQEQERYMVKIKIKYFAEDIEKLKYIDGKSDMIDLRAAEDVTMRAGEFKLIPLGVAMELPRGFEAHIYPRSSTYKNFGLTQANSVGVIDNSYCGDNDQWMYPAVASRNVTIHKNDRICQFRIVRNQPDVVFCEVNSLGVEDRGGFGSTGKQVIYIKNDIPIWEKINLTIEEAANYSNIGINRINKIAKQPNCSFVLYVGKKKLIKRKEFEKYLEKVIEL